MAIKKGRVAIVTGAGQGLGEGIAKRLAAEGANVVAVDMNPATVEKVVADIIAAGGDAVAVVADVGTREGTETIAKTAMDKWGTIDILVNNAGINRDAAFYKMTEQQWDDVLRVNLKGVFMMMQACYWPMRNQKYGRIINLSSSACRGNRGQANYAAAKAAIVALSNTFALENAKHGITCNTLCPGAIDTPMARAVPDEVLQGWIDAIPAGRIGKPEDIAEMVAFFAGEGAEYINGQQIWVDGAFQTGMKAKG